MKFKVRNLKSPKGNTVANQYEIEGNGIILFQSYNTIIAKIDRNRNIILDKKMWDFSRTTLKYLAIFIDDNFGYKLHKKDAEYMIQEGHIKLRDLNK